MTEESDEEVQGRIMLDKLPLWAAPIPWLLMMLLGISVANMVLLFILLYVNMR